VNESFVVVPACGARKASVGDCKRWKRAVCDLGNDCRAAGRHRKRKLSRSQSDNDMYEMSVARGARRAMHLAGGPPSAGLECIPATARPQPACWGRPSQAQQRPRAGKVAYAEELCSICGRQQGSPSSLSASGSHAQQSRRGAAAPAAAVGAIWVTCVWTVGVRWRVCPQMYYCCPAQRMTTQHTDVQATHPATAGGQTNVWGCADRLASCS
jgi:hypothetical protein